MPSMILALHEFLSTSVSGMDSSPLLAGHPYGVRSILYRKFFVLLYYLISCSDCFCVVKLLVPHFYGLVCTCQLNAHHVLSVLTW